MEPRPVQSEYVSSWTGTRARRPRAVASRISAFTAASRARPSTSPVFVVKAPTSMAPCAARRRRLQERRLPRRVEVQALDIAGVRREVPDFDALLLRQLQGLGRGDAEQAEAILEDAVLEDGSFQRGHQEERPLAVPRREADGSARAQGG